MSRALKMKSQIVHNAEMTLRPMEPFVAPGPADAFTPLAASAVAGNSAAAGYSSPHHESSHHDQNQLEHTHADHAEQIELHTPYLPRIRITTLIREPLETAGYAGNPSNIWFNWNGHSWCAFEVLGVPGGSAVAHAQDAFRTAISNSAVDSHPFLNEAIQAIERRCK